VRHRLAAGRASKQACQASLRLNPHGKMSRAKQHAGSGLFRRLYPGLVDVGPSEPVRGLVDSVKCDCAKAPVEPTLALLPLFVGGKHQIVTGGP
jgi:hypothetical protein